MTMKGLIVFRGLLSFIPGEAPCWVLSYFKSQEKACKTKPFISSPTGQPALYFGSFSTRKFEFNFNLGWGLCLEIGFNRVPTWWFRLFWGRLTHSHWLWWDILQRCIQKGQMQAKKANSTTALLEKSHRPKHEDLCLLRSPPPTPTPPQKSVENSNSSCSTYDSSPYTLCLCLMSLQANYKMLKISQISTPPTSFLWTLVMQHALVTLHPSSTLSEQ